MTLFGETINPGNNRKFNGQIPGQIPSPARVIKTAAAVIAALIFCLIFFNYIASITRIGAGYVGVEVVLSGSQRGPAEIPIRTGWGFYSPLRSQIIEFPPFVQTVKWTHDLNEGPRHQRRDELQLERRH